MAEIKECYMIGNTINLPSVSYAVHGATFFVQEQSFDEGFRISEGCICFKDSLGTVWSIFTNLSTADMIKFICGGISGNPCNDYSTFSLLGDSCSSYRSNGAYSGSVSGNTINSLTLPNVTLYDHCLNRIWPFCEDFDRVSNQFVGAGAVFASSGSPIADVGYRGNWTTHPLNCTGRGFYTDTSSSPYKYIPFRVSSGYETSYYEKGSGLITLDDGFEIGDGIFCTELGFLVEANKKVYCKSGLKFDSFSELYSYSGGYEFYAILQGTGFPNGGIARVRFNSSKEFAEMRYIVGTSADNNYKGLTNFPSQGIADIYVLKQGSTFINSSAHRGLDSVLRFYTSSGQVYINKEALFAESSFPLTLGSSGYSIDRIRVTFDEASSSVYTPDEETITLTGGTYLPNCLLEIVKRTDVSYYTMQDKKFSSCGKVS